MAKKTVIEAEGQELVLSNTNGDTIIIPKNRRNEALKHLKNNNYSAIDKIASELPYMEDYAEDGTLISEQEIIAPIDPPTGTSKQTTNKPLVMSDADIGNRNIRGGSGYDYSGKSYKPTSGAMSIYKQKLDAGDLEGADAVELGHYYTGKVSGYSEESNELGFTKPLRVSDLGDIPKDRRSEISNYDLYTGNLSGQENVAPVDLEYGGKVKAVNGLVVENENLEPIPEPLPEVSTDPPTGGDGDKAKKVQKTVTTTGIGRISTQNFPQYGLTSEEDINKFMSSEVSGPRTEKTAVNKLQEKYACTGSACRATQFRLPELPSTYDLYRKYGLNTAQTGTKGDASDAGFDAWEIHQALRNENLGNNLFTSEHRDDASDEDYVKQRKQNIENFDPSKITVGTVIGRGDALDLNLFEKGDKASYIKKGVKQDIDPTTQKSRHTMTVMGFDEETGDTFVYNYGNVIRIGKSQTSDYDTWQEFLKGERVNYITSLSEKEAGNWTYKNLKQGKKQLSKK